MILIKQANRSSLKTYGLAVLSGVIASLALPPLGLYVGLFALSYPMIMAVGMARAHARLRHAAFLGGMTGLGWFLFSLSWISNALITSGGAHLLLIPFSLVGLPLFLGLFWAAAFAAAHVIIGRSQNIMMKMGFNANAAHLTVLIVLLSLAEYLRGVVLTGFPWNAPGLIMAHDAWGLHIASVIGTWGSTLLVLIAGAVPAFIMGAGRAIGGASLAFVIIIGGGSQFAATPERPSPHDGMLVRVLQPNIAQMDKWVFAKRRHHLAALMSASRQPSDRPLDLVVWPETAFAGIYERERGVASAIMQAAAQGQTPILTGILSQDENPFRLYNAAMLFNEKGQMTDGVAKQHLVPFGDYAPLRSVLPFVDAIAGPVDFSAGHGPQSLPISRDGQSPVKALTLICYEVIFPQAVRKTALNEGADIMIVITNDAWFGNTIGPRQHLAMAQMRAAELGMPLIRSANTGISAIIDAKGKILTSLDYGQAGYLDMTLPAARDTTYRHIGDAAYLLMMMIFALLVGCLGLTKFGRKE